VEVDAYLGRKFKGKVTEIANSASNVGTGTLNTDQVTNFVVKIRVDANSYVDMVKDRQYPFRPGMSASVDIYTNTADSTLSVPLIAVTARDEDADKKEEKKDEETNPQKEEKEKDLDNIKEIVFVVTGDTVAMREVKTGIQDNDYIQVLNGLQEGDKVVTGPYAAIARKLKGGTRVVVVDKKGKSSDAKAAD
jgi:HlyD family secretion protein